MNKLYFSDTTVIDLRRSRDGASFCAAGTLDYWQAYVFMAVFVGRSAAILLYLAIKRSQAGAADERRANGGKGRPKIIMIFVLLVSSRSLFRHWTVASCGRPSAVGLCDRRHLVPWIFVSVASFARIVAASTPSSRGQTVISTGPPPLRHRCMPECFLHS
jgi:hypothetical protein